FLDGDHELPPYLGGSRLHLRSIGPGHTVRGTFVSCRSIVRLADYDARWLHGVLCGANIDDRYELVTQSVAIVVQANLQGERHGSTSRLCSVRSRERW